MDSNKKALVDAYCNNSSSPKQGQVVDDKPESMKQREQVIRLFDPVHGGLQGAPKFPQSPILDFLWRRALATGNEATSRGGVRIRTQSDVPGREFTIISAAALLVTASMTAGSSPTSEKMLYDNALAARPAQPMLYALDRVIGSSPPVPSETVGWLHREMMVEQADSLPHSMPTATAKKENSTSGMNGRDRPGSGRRTPLCSKKPSTSQPSRQLGRQNHPQSILGRMGCYPEDQMKRYAPAHRSGACWM